MLCNSVCAVQDEDYDNEDVGEDETEAEPDDIMDLGGGGTCRGRGQQQQQPPGGQQLTVRRDSFISTSAHIYDYYRGPTRICCSFSNMSFVFNVGFSLAVSMHAYDYTHASQPNA